MNTMYYGEQKEHTPKELNFMVRAHANCQRLQEAGECEFGEECAGCKWAVGIQESKTLDPLTQARMQDKVDAYIRLGEVSDAIEEREKKRAKRQFYGLFVLIAVILLAIFIGVAAESDAFAMNYNDTSVQSCVNTPQKCRMLPPNPTPYYEYNFTDCLAKTMIYLKWNGPWMYGDDDCVDCKDWTMSFVFYWYEELNAPDGTCIIVRNVNKNKRFDHCFVALWNNHRWVCIEPQACRYDDWSLEFFWGDRYDPRFNCYNETRKFCTWAYLDNFARDIIKRSRVDEVYGVDYWDDTNPIQYHTDRWE